MNYLLDTNVVSELMRPEANPKVLQWIDAKPEGNIYLSVITVGEIRKGINSLAPGRRRDVLEAWLTMDLLERFEGKILAVTVEVANIWGRLAAQGKAAGVAFAVLDGFIAATAAVHSMAVATRNVADFAGHGVEIVDPWQAG